MTGLSDFQVAMIVMGTILTIFGLAALASMRRPIVPAVVAPIAPGAPAILSDRQTTDAIGADVTQLKTDLVKHDTRLGEVEHHLAQVRTMLGALPSKDAVNKLEVKLTELGGRVDLNHEIAVRSSRALERIEDFLLKGGKA